MAARRVCFRRMIRRHLRRERVYRDRNNPFDLYDDVELYARFRFRRVDIVYLCDLIQEDIDHPVPRKGSLPPIMQLMVALRFYATGSFQIVIGDIFGIDRSTVSRIIARVSQALSARINEFVKFPASEYEARKLMADFYQLANFPNVVGCVDCTHVRIVAPTEKEVEFVNRKGNHSINCQLICDANLLITHCVVKWPGSVHDSRILKQSRIWQLFERAARPVLGVLLGDSGYPLREWLMTPFLDANTRAKERFNSAHRTTRSTIERTNDVLKKRWQCLQSELRYDPALACKITISCIVLHNVATTLGLPHPDYDTDSDESDSSDSELDDGNNEQDGVQSGRLARDRIVARYFQQHSGH